MQLIDPNHPIYKPLWVRLVIVGICFGWAIVEAFGPQPFWAVIAGALGIYSAYMLLLTFNPQAPKAEAETIAPADDSEKAQEEEK